jgi:excisionase family DNA binding protein
VSRSTAAPPVPLMTVTQAAERLGTSTSELYELVARRAVPSVRIGRAIRIPQDDLEDLDQLERSGDPRRSSTSRRPVSDPGSSPERNLGARHPGEDPQPHSREAASQDTDLHPRATRRRVDGQRRRASRS